MIEYHIKCLDTRLEVVSSDYGEVTVESLLGTRVFPLRRHAAEPHLEKSYVTDCMSYTSNPQSL